MDRGKTAAISVATICGFFLLVAIGFIAYVMIEKKRASSHAPGHHGRHHRAPAPSPARRPASSPGSASRYNPAVPPASGGQPAYAPQPGSDSTADGTGVPYDPTQVPTQGDVSAAAQSNALTKAIAATRRSSASAARVAMGQQPTSNYIASADAAGSGGLGAGNGGMGAAANGGMGAAGNGGMGAAGNGGLGAGYGGQMTASAMPTPIPLSAPLGAGKLGSAVADVAGANLVGAQQSLIKNVGGVDVDSLSDEKQRLFLQTIDKETSDTLDKSLSLSGTPGTFFNTEAEDAQRKAQSIVDNMMLNATSDPSVEQMMGASSVFNATSLQIQRSIAARSAVDREMIISTPLRFMWQPPLYRPAVPMPTVGVVLQNDVTPGLAFYLQSIACGEGPVVQESF